MNTTQATSTTSGEAQKTTTSESTSRTVYASQESSIRLFKKENWTIQSLTEVTKRKTQEPGHTKVGRKIPDIEEDEYEEGEESFLSNKLKLTLLIAVAIVVLLVLPLIIACTIIMKRRRRSKARKKDAKIKPEILGELPGMQATSPMDSKEFMGMGAKDGPSKEGESPVARKSKEKQATSPMEINTKEMEAIFGPSRAKELSREGESPVAEKSNEPLGTIGPSRIDTYFSLPTH
ncbi:unnamed protein product [Cylicocyclus nassatus]|uniref:Uncharacterized protein n=1 Tax=Cylicocyclus nassatus TaxID=53992 RepID=A0AA36DK85_CYLNA|nr:unnamed protein product [Cylicocyclus nassatus]